MKSHEQADINYYGGIGIIIDKILHDRCFSTCTITFDRRLLPAKDSNYIIRLMQTYAKCSACGNVYRIIFKIIPSKLPKFYKARFFEQDLNNPKCYIYGAAEILFAHTVKSIDYRFKYINPFGIEEQTKNFITFLNRYMRFEIQTMWERDHAASPKYAPGSDKDILNKMYERYKGKFTRLYYYGDISVSPSESVDGAGLSLTNMIARFTHNKWQAASIIKRIFKQSQLYRNYTEHWENGNHLDETIKTSLATYNKPRTKR